MTGSRAVGLATWGVAAALLLGGGCVAQTRVLGPRVEECEDCATCPDCLAGNVCVAIGGKRVHTRQGLRALSAYERDPDEPPPTEQDLLDAVEEEPESPSRWWALGDYYESERRYTDALAAYQELQIRIERTTRADAKTYTGGLFLIGKMYARLGSYGEAVRYMQAVLEHQPESLVSAARYRNFREAHFVLGWIYLQHDQLDLAEQHLEAFRDLTPGSFRADGLLIKIADARRRKAALEGAFAPQREAPAAAGSVPR